MHWHLWRLGDLFPWIAVPSELLLNPNFLQEGTLLFHTTSFHLQNRGTSSVLARISSRWSWLFLTAKYGSHRFLFFVQSMSLNNWHEDDPICEFRFNGSFQQIMMDFLKNLQWRKSWENIPLEFSQLLLHQFPAILSKKRTLWILPPGLPIFGLLLHELGIFPRQSTESE